MTIKHFITILLILLITESHAQHFTATNEDIKRGYMVKNIALNSYSKPTIQLLNPEYISIARNAQQTNNALKEMKLVMGMEKKKPFVLVFIPIIKDSKQLVSFDLNIIENPNIKLKNTAKTTVSNALLANGTWYKIALNARGIYKIDYNFLKTKLGITPENINANHIHIYGNGGKMLSENNALPRPNDLIENVIEIHDGGDGIINSNDYILFYADGLMGWKWDKNQNKFTHQSNLYNDNCYYFINIDNNSSNTISNSAPLLTSNKTVTSFNDYQVIEEQLHNPGRFGKYWWGYELGSQAGYNSKTYSFQFPTAIDTSTIYFKGASRSTEDNNLLSLSINNVLLNQYNLSKIVIGSDDANPVTVAEQSISVLPIASGKLNFKLDYASTVTDAKAYLGCLEINTRRNLEFTNGFLAFRDINSVGVNSQAKYVIQNANNELNVWDVTNPLSPIKITGTINGTTYSFIQNATDLHEFVAFDHSNLAVPSYIGTVNNQNLHGHDQVDYIIVTAPTFVSAAQRLANYHTTHDQMRSLVVTTDQIYNEFSSGSQDISAIRDFIKMFYDRAGNDTNQMPKSVLMLGGASYDYKNRISNNTNFVPSFESQESINVSESYCVDDFYGFLDDNENIEDLSVANTLDIGIGRLPVQTLDEANAMVDKIVSYHDSASLGPWRLSNMYIGDNKDGAGNHEYDAEGMEATINAHTQLYNDSKVYLDNLPFISTPAGDRCPAANTLINDQIFNGTFLMNYNGHGSPVTLAHERICTVDDFNNWENVHQLPFIVTATCDFSRFDDPALSSAGEKMILKEKGGAIALLTTTQSVYAGLNHDLNAQFLAAQFSKNSAGKNITFGEAFAKGKNATYQIAHNMVTIVNFRRFVLLGDPALLPAFPQYKVVTDSLVSLTTNLPVDTMRALGTYKINGSIRDDNNTLLPNFNGKIYITIYDKARTIAMTIKNTTEIQPYSIQDNVIFKGIASVTNGLFSIAFIAPKDINYNFGKGKISYYAENSITDAAGFDTSKIIGGNSQNGIQDFEGPIVHAYMNDSLFIDGGLVGSNPYLYAILEDESGINVSGNSVGHDLTAILDGNEQKPYILNDYYENFPNTYQRGFLKFPMKNLSSGNHSITIKAWDVNNNSGTGTVHFYVGNTNDFQINNLRNYPNPFKDLTHFYFEHNKTGENIHARIYIFSADGRRIKTIETTYQSDASQSTELTWDGTDYNNAKLPDGVYPYKLLLTDDQGNTTTGYNKMILIR